MGRPASVKPLIVDLSGQGSHPLVDVTPTIELHTLAAALRSPRRLWRLLRSESYDDVVVRHGDIPLSALQAAAQLALVFARADAWSVGGQHHRRGAFAARALLDAMRALVSELAWSALATINVLRINRCSFALPRSSNAQESALYLRVEPSLRWLGTQVGGAATHTRGVVNGLIDNGVQVRVVAAERPVGTDRASFTRAQPRRILQMVRGLAYADYSRTVIRAAAGQTADFVYQRHQLGSFAGLAIARRLQVPLVLEFNGPEVWVERNWRSSRRLLLENALEQLERHHLHEASLVVVVSEALRKHVLAQGVPAHRVLVNPNGVDVDELAAYRQRSASEWRRYAGLPDVPTVGFIGTFGPWHGAHLLPTLIAAVPEARWVLIGGGGLFDEVRAEIEARELLPRVTLTGVLGHERALEFLSCGDVCVSPHIPSSDQTPFFGSPTKLFEYMGLAKPIVASDLGQIGEVIEHGRSGLLCAPGDVPGMANAIRRLLTDEPLRARLAARALERATAEYGWSAHVRRVLDALGGTHGRPSSYCAGSLPS
jgi:glycosyltransferase involved in cell wall biosynthesis